MVVQVPLMGSYSSADASVVALLPLPVRMGGGYYEDGAPPPGSRDLGSCVPPFFLSTGFTD
ncbi:MAG TPA: hypothetical protein VMP86_04460 [Candidatus Binatia bacterium]|nr:hypothetical protein [Candidatus Binatia bacterium]